MSTDKAIDKLAEGFCKLSKPEYKDLYVKALQSLVRIAQAEQVTAMQRDFDNCTGVKDLPSFPERASRLQR